MKATLSFPLRFAVCAARRALQRGSGAGVNGGGGGGTAAVALSRRRHGRRRRGGGGLRGADKYAAESGGYAAGSNDAACCHRNLVGATFGRKVGAKRLPEYIDLRYRM